jgi:anti-sigma factor RsiW
MNSQNSRIDDALIDRLVDGELPADERRQVLLALESHPEGWRRCALAFIEAQTWRSQMRGMLAGEVVSHPAAASPALTGEPNLAPAAKARARQRNGGMWLAAAAMLLIAFGLGRQLGVSERQSLQQAQLAGSGSGSEASPDVAPDQDAPRGDAVTLVVNDHRGVPHRLSVPLVEGRQLGAEFADTPNWSSSELRRRLDAQGLDLAARRRYVPLYFEQQNQQVPFIVPVDDAVVTPVSRPVF